VAKVSTVTKLFFRDTALTQHYLFFWSAFRCAMFCQEKILQDVVVHLHLQTKVA